MYRIDLCSRTITYHHSGTLVKYALIKNLTNNTVVKEIRPLSSRAMSMISALVNTCLIWDLYMCAVQLPTVDYTYRN